MPQPEPQPIEPTPPTAQILGMDGRPMRPSQFQPAPQTNPSYLGGSGNGSDAMIDIAGLKKNVNFLNWAVAFMFAGAFIMAWAVDQRAEGRDDKSGQKVEKIAEKVEDLKVSSAEQRSDLKSILEKLNERQSDLKPSQTAK